MAILLVTLYEIGRLTGFGVKHVQFLYFLSIALTTGLSVFYILCAILIFSKHCTDYWTINILHYLLH